MVVRSEEPVDRNSATENTKKLTRSRKRSGKIIEKTTMDNTRKDESEIIRIKLSKLL